MESRQRICPGCDRELINAQGVHMGVPFGKPPGTVILVCAKCYDNFINQRTGDETI